MIVSLLPIVSMIHKQLDQRMQGHGNELDVPKYISVHDVVKIVVVIHSGVSTIQRV